MNNIDTCDIETRNIVVKAIDNISRVKWKTHTITNQELQYEVNYLELL